MLKALTTFARRGVTVNKNVPCALFSTNTDSLNDLAGTEKTLVDAAAPVKTKKVVEAQKKDDGTSNAEDIFRANTLAGLGDKYHAMNRAFDMIKQGVALTPEMEKDLALIYDVTSLKTADSQEIRKAKTRALVEHYQRRPGDTGSTEVQVVLLTERINNLKFHLTRNVADKQLVLPLTKMIVRRRKYLQYLRKERFRTYQIICRDLGIDEDEYWKVGRLPRTKPYYDPNRPKYGRPITDAFKKTRLTKPGTKVSEKLDKTAGLIANTYVF